MARSIEKPFETPLTMLLRWARAVPHWVLARGVSTRGLSTILPPSSATAISDGTASDDLPSLPLMATFCPATCTLTPLGTVTGCLPIRDIDCSLEHLAEDFAAHVLGARLGIRHDATRRRQDRDAQPAIDLGQIRDLRIDPPAGCRNPRDLSNHRLALVILELD